MNQLIARLKQEQKKRDKERQALYDKENEAWDKEIEKHPIYTPKYIREKN
jgi:hypothetical protein